MLLDRDDRGGRPNDFILVKRSQDPVPDSNRETVSIRGIVAGGIHRSTSTNFIAMGPRTPLPVSVKVREKLNPTVQVVYYDTIMLQKPPETERTARSGFFDRRRRPAILDVNHHEKSLLQTLRNPRRNAG